MSEQSSQEKQPNVDSTAVLKEFNEKLEQFSKNIDSKIEGLRSQAAPVVNQVVEQDDDLASLIYSDPNKAVEKITKKVEAQVEKRLTSQSQSQQEFSDTYMKLMNDYPEIGNQGSKLHNRARELVVELSQGRQYDSAALERAVYRAANELGVAAMKQRKQQEEESDDGSYTGAGAASTSGRKARRDEDSLDPRTLAFAQMIGKDVNDPAYLKKLKEINKNRKGSWGRYS